MSCPSVYAESVVCGLVDGSIEKTRYYLEITGLG